MHCSIREWKMYFLGGSFCTFICSNHCNRTQRRVSATSPSLLSEFNIQRRNYLESVLWPYATAFPIDFTTVIHQLRCLFFSVCLIPEESATSLPTSYSLHLPYLLQELGGICSILIGPHFCTLLNHEICIFEAYVQNFSTDLYAISLLVGNLHTKSSTPLLQSDQPNQKLFFNSNKK